MDLLSEILFSIWFSKLFQASMGTQFKYNKQRSYAFMPKANPFPSIPRTLTQTHPESEPPMSSLAFKNKAKHARGRGSGLSDTLRVVW
jgi:hypothetical protein